MHTVANWSTAAGYSYTFVSMLVWMDVLCLCANMYTPWPIYAPSQNTSSGLAWVPFVKTIGPTPNSCRAHDTHRGPYRQYVLWTQHGLKHSNWERFVWVCPLTAVTAVSLQRPIWTKGTETIANVLTIIVAVVYFFIVKNSCCYCCYNPHGGRF